MPDARARVVVEAHALRKSTAMAALLHGSRKGPRDLKRPFAALIVSLVLGALLLLAFWGISRVGDLLQQQRRNRAADVSQVQNLVLLQETLGGAGLVGGQHRAVPACLHNGVCLAGRDLPGHPGDLDHVAPEQWQDRGHAVAL